MKIAAIDPGTRVVGYCIVEWRKRRLRVLEMGTIRPGARQVPKRLNEILRSLEKLFRRHRPAEVVVEKAYVGKNAATAIRLGEGRGLVLAAAAGVGADVHEITAVESKKAATGNGRAAKSAVQRGVQLLLGLDELPQSDEADAAALAICRANDLWGW